MCVVSSKTLLKDNEYFKFNGKRIVSIYAVYENSRYTKKGYEADILYYNCYVHRFDCGVKYGKDYGAKVLKVKTLPKEMKGLFGFVENKGKKIFVTNLWIRESDSCNGSFADQTLDLNGWALNATDSGFGLYRGVEYLNKEENSLVISENSKLANKITKLFGKSFKVEEVTEFAELGAKMKEGSLDFATKYPYPHTPIRIIDGLVYPDEKLPSWRWLHGMPYRVPNDAVKQFGDKVYPTSTNDIRVWDDCLKAHLYLQKVDKVEEGEEGLVTVDFRGKSHDIYGYEGSAYCHIRRYNESCGFVFKTFTVKKVNKKTGDVVCDSYRNMTIMEKNLKGNQTDFYRITKRVYSSCNENED